jgi:hypothetical protein
MNQGMKASIGLLIYLLPLMGLFSVISWAIGWPFNKQDPGAALVFLGTVFSLIMTIFLSSWFGLLIKRRPALTNILTYYLLSSVLGVLMQGSFVLSVVIAAKGIQAIPSEFVKLRNDFVGNPDLWIVFSVLLSVPLMFTTIAVFERQSPASNNNF